MSSPSRMANLSPITSREPIRVIGRLEIHQYFILLKTMSGDRFSLPPSGTHQVRIQFSAWVLRDCLDGQPRNGSTSLCLICTDVAPANLGGGRGDGAQTRENLGLFPAQPTFHCSENQWCIVFAVRKLLFELLPKIKENTHLHDCRAAWEDLCLPWNRPFTVPALRQG